MISHLPESFALPVLLHCQSKFHQAQAHSNGPSTKAMSLPTGDLLMLEAELPSTSLDFQSATSRHVNPQQYPKSVEMMACAVNCISPQFTTASGGESHIVNCLGGGRFIKHESYLNHPSTGAPETTRRTSLGKSEGAFSSGNGETRRETLASIHPLVFSGHETQQPTTATNPAREHISLTFRPDSGG